MIGWLVLMQPWK